MAEVTRLGTRADVDAILAESARRPVFVFKYEDCCAVATRALPGRELDEAWPQAVTGLERRGRITVSPWEAEVWGSEFWAAHVEPAAPVETQVKEDLA